MLRLPPNSGDNRRQPQTMQHPQPLTEHGGSQSAAPATNSGDISVECCHKVPRLPRILRVEVHKVLRLPRILHVNKQVNTLITMEGRTGDHRRQPPTTQHPQPLTERGGSQSAAPATNSGDISVCVVTKCRACHEFCTWRFTKCCACHKFCTSTNK